MAMLCYIKRDHPVHTICSKCPPSPETHAGIFWHFPQTVGNFSPNFTRLLYVPITNLYVPITLDYKFLFNYLQLWRSCHIKSDRPACVLADGMAFLSMMVVALNIA